MSTSIYLAVPVMAFLTIVQAAVLPRFPILGLVPQLPFLVAIVWGLLHNRDEGALWAFIAGFFLDLVSMTPMGVTSLSYMIAVVSVTWLAQVFPISRFILPVIMAILASLIYLLLSFVFLRLLGYQTSLETATSLSPLAVLHGVIILPIYWLIYLLDRTLRPRRVEI